MLHLRLLPPPSPLPELLFLVLPARGSSRLLLLLPGGNARLKLPINQKSQDCRLKR
jgi:hypothetical protein